MVFLITLLHALNTITFAANWSFTRSAFIGNEKSFWAVYLKLNNTGQALSLEIGIPASITTILADLYMIWCCWIVWGRRWHVVLLPILSLISATVLKVFEVYHEYFDAPAASVFQLLYISFILATTLSCTLLIIFRILTVTGTRWGAEGRLRVFHRLIEVLVQSSALYSISLTLDLAFAIRDSLGGYYSDVIAGIAKGIAPTLLVGRVAAGHTRPNDDCDEIAISTLRFQPPSEAGTTNPQESTTQTSAVEIDIEGQQQ
ncbi:hypothetical protein F5146DRAFT_1041288 [Armillaria mellea]|nr:hypothetical protein F5146DRAFT_1041288 [Armillaria mellea]